MLKKQHYMKRFLSFAIILLITVTPIFAADDDFGFNAYTSKVVSWFYAIAAGLIVLSLIIWGMSCVIKHGITPKDWVALAAILGGGIVIILAVTVVSGIFSGGPLGEFNL